MKKLQLSFGFELDEVNPNLEEYINNLQTRLTDFFLLSGGKVIDSKFNIEYLTEPAPNKEVCDIIFPFYEYYPLNINGKTRRVLVHTDNQYKTKGGDYPGIEVMQEIISLNLPLYKQQDIITNVFFYHRCVFVSYTRYKRPDFLVFYEGESTRFKTLEEMQNFIDTNIV